MSTILKALRRVEEQRSAQAPRPLREQVAAGPTPSARSGWLAAGLALVAGMGVGIALLRFWPDDEPAREAPASDVVDARTQAPPVRSPEASGRSAREPAPGAVSGRAPREPAESPARSRSVPAGLPSAAAPPSLPREAFASEVAVVDRPPAAPPVAPPPEPAARPGASRPQPEPSRQAAARAEPAPAPERRGAVRDSVSSAPESRVASASRSEPGAASGSQEPRAATRVARAELPDLVVTRTVWHPTPARRLAILDVEGSGRLELREGDAVGPLVIESITPSGVVFEHDGVEVRRRVGAP